MRDRTVLLLVVLWTASAGGLFADTPCDPLGDPLPKGAVQRLGTRRMKTSVRDLAYLPDGRGVTITSKHVEFWDLAQGKLQESIRVSDAVLTSMTRHPQRDVLLITDAAGKVFEWDWKRKTRGRGWNTGLPGLLSARYSPDGKRVLTCGNPPRVKEWDLAGGKPLIEIKSEMVTTRCGAIYGPNAASIIVGGGYNHNLERYERSTGKLLKKWCSVYEAKDLALSPDQKYVTLGLEDRAREYCLADYKVFRTYKHCPGEAARVFSVAYLPKTDEMLCGGRDGSIHRWERASGKLALSWKPHDGFVSRMCVSPDEQWVLSYGRYLLIETSTRTGKPRLQWDRHMGSVESVAFFPSGDRVVSGSSDTTLRIWNVADGRTVKLIRNVGLGAYGLDVSPDGTRIAAACKDGMVREFRAEDGAPLRELAGHRGYVRAVRYTRDGARLLSTADDGTVRVWTTDKNEPLTTLQGHRGGVLAVDIDADGRRVLAGGRDGTVRLWDVNTGKPLWTSAAHRGWVESVVFLPNGAGALSAGRDGRILCRRIEDGGITREFDAGTWTYALAVSPDGTRLFSAGQSPAIACWDLKTGQKTGSLSGHRGQIRCIALSRDGKRLVSGCLDTTLLVWAVP